MTRSAPVCVGMRRDLTALLVIGSIRLGIVVCIFSI